MPECSVLDSDTAGGRLGVNKTPQVAASLVSAHALTPTVLMPSSPLKRIGRRLGRPFTAPLDGRVADINRRVDHARSAADEHGQLIGEKLEELIRELGAFATTAVESNAYVGVEMRRFIESIEALGGHLDEHETRVLARVDALEDKSYVERLNRAAEAPLGQLDGAVANLINHADGHRGFAAQAGLWFNPPVTVELSEGRAKLAKVNERIVELPFAMGALARLTAPARILDIGSAESTFPLSAASLGYEVTALDLRPLPYSHPNLKSFPGRFEDWDARAERFDAAFLISTIEHFGLGAYGEAIDKEGADRAALELVAGLLNDGGFLVLTTPLGQAHVDSLERTYDEQTLAALLEGWTVLDRQTVYRLDEQTWAASDPNESSKQGVAMVIAAPNRHA